MATERIISADSHVNPPKDLWTHDRPAAAQGARAARRVDAAGRLLDRRLADHRRDRARLLGRPEARGVQVPRASTYKDMRPGSYDPKARLDDMDLDGVDAEVLYFGGPVTQYAEDPELRALRRPRYNDWMVELSKAAPDRLIGLAHIPLLDLDEGMARARARREARAQGLPRRPVPGRARRQAALGPGLRAVLGAGRRDGAADQLPHRRAAQRRTCAATFMNPTPGREGDLHRDRADLDLRGRLDARSSPASSRAIRSSSSCSSSAASAGSRTSSSAWTRPSTSTASGPSRSSPRSRAPTGTGRATRRSSRTSPASPSATARGCGTSCGRPTTRTRDSTWPKSREALEEHFKDVPDDERELIAGGNAAALYGLN